MFFLGSGFGMFLGVWDVFFLWDFGIFGMVFVWGWDFWGVGIFVGWGVARCWTFCWDVGLDLSIGRQEKKKGLKFDVRFKK